MKNKILLAGVVAMGMPVIAFAQNDITWFEDIVDTFLSLLNKLPGLFLAVAVVYFLWGAMKFVSAGDNEEKRKGGQSSMIWGIVGIVIMVSMWGIINIVQTAVFEDVDQEQVAPIELPDIN